MKKITYLLALLCSALFSTTAMAKEGDVVTDLSQLSSSKAYVLTTARGTLQAGDSIITAVETADQSLESQQFAFVKPSDDATSYYIFSISKNRFLGIDNSWASVFSANGTFTINATNNESYPFYLQASNSNWLNIDNYRTVLIDGWKTLDDGNRFSFTEAADLDEDAQNAISNMLSLYSDAELAEIKRAFTAYSNASSEEKCYTTFKSIFETEKASAENDIVNWSSANLKAAYNTFLAGRSSFLTDNQKVIIGNKLHTDRYMYAQSSAKAGSGKSLDTPRYLWTIKKQSDGTVKLYNEYTNLWMGSIPTANDTKISLVEEADAKGYTAIKSGDYVNFVDLTFSDVSRAALHMVDWDGIVRWKNASDSKASYFVINSDITETLTSWANNLQASIGENVGDVKSTSEISAAADALTAAVSNVNSYVDAYKKLETALASASTITPEEGTYYTIEVARRDAHLGHKLVESYDTNSNTGDNYALQHVTTPSNLVPALWQFENADEEGQYNLKAANSGLYLSKTGGVEYHLRTLASDSEDKGTYTIGKTSVSVAHAVSLYDVAGNNLISTRVEDNDVVAWSGNDGSGNNFFVKAVTELPVVISSVGYATLNLPFAVTIPEGVKAYKGTRGDAEITLTELTSVIPAQQPVILVGEGGTYNFPIASANIAADESGLSGTLTPVAIAAEATAYVLKNGEHGVGMYKITSETDRTIGANKAYVAVGSDAAANVLAFNFGNVTGINNAAAVDAKANAYFDLNGRRVLYPVHGVFVKGNGQKVYIK